MDVSGIQSIGIGSTMKNSSGDDIRNIITDITGSILLDKALEKNDPLNKISKKRVLMIYQQVFLQRRL